MPIKKENYYLIKRHFYRILGFRCGICGRYGDENGKYIDDSGQQQILEFDHIIPNGTPRHDVSRSVREWEWFAAFEKNNLQLACKICNIKKSDKTIV